jgi:hypothetical protein
MSGKQIAKSSAEEELRNSPECNKNGAKQPENVFVLSRGNPPGKWSNATQWVAFQESLHRLGLE